MKFTHDADEIESVMQSAYEAFHIYKNLSLKTRADFMRQIAEEMQADAKDIITMAMAETHLPEDRIQSEFDRTKWQMVSYAAHCETGQWLELRIDEAQPENKKQQTDIRKTKIGLGPIVVFGAGNFPLAYSTAGGDTACAFAAGCPVIVKAHGGHAKTSELVAIAILRAADKCNMPEGIFAHVEDKKECAEKLIMHPHTAAVGFTGSFAGGKQFYDWAAQREKPIPVFAEMSSVNPVFLLPEKLKKESKETAKKLGESIMQSMGQFCTNPGIIVGIKGEHLNKFIDHLAKIIDESITTPMLNEGIYKNYEAKLETALKFGHLSEKTTRDNTQNNTSGIPTIATVEANYFIENKKMQSEVFGPYSLVVQCNNEAEMLEVAKRMEGQLTATIIGTEAETKDQQQLINILQEMAGRLIFNGVPTGVQVSLAMLHGGPFPATTDSRFTAVGADGMARFARPVAYQNWPDELLPAELQNGNPLQIVRTVNGKMEGCGGSLRVV